MNTTVNNVQYIEGVLSRPQLIALSCDIFLECIYIYIIRMSATDSQQCAVYPRCAIQTSVVIALSCGML